MQTRVWYNEFSAVIEFEYMDNEPMYGAINRQPPFNMLVWGLLKLTSIKLCTDSCMVSYCTCDAQKPVSIVC